LSDELYMKVLDYSAKNNIGKVSTAIRILLTKALEGVA